MGATAHSAGSFQPPSVCSEAWTVERVALLRKLWSEGYSAAQIACQLGGVTRNAVIGKVNRLGLSSAGRPINPARTSLLRRRPGAQAVPYKRPKQTGQGLRTGASFNSSFAPKVVEDRSLTWPEPAPVIEMLDIPFGQRKTLVQLTPDTCRWPIGDPSAPDFFFCGGDVADGKVYCNFHCCVAYVPIDRRRQAKAHRYYSRNC